MKPMSDTSPALPAMTGEAHGPLGARVRRGPVAVGIWPLVAVTTLVFLFLALTRPNFLTYTNLYGLLFEISISFLAIQ